MNTMVLVDKVKRTKIKEMAVKAFYKQYVDKTIRTVWLKEWTAEFLQKLDAISHMGRKTIESCCEEYKGRYIKEIKSRSEARAKKQNKELTETSWKNSAANNMSQVRNAIKAWASEVPLDENNSYPQRTKNGVINQHVALLVMNFSSDFHFERMQPTEEKKQTQRRNLVDINNVDQYQAVIENLLESRGWREVTVGLIAATGRRAAEILKTAEFKQVGQFEVEFSGQLKAKGEERKSYLTFTLIESNKVCDALLRLRRMPEIKKLKRKTLAEIDSGSNNTINRLVVEIFSPIIEPPTGELQLSTKNLRASYVALAIYLFCPWKQEPSQFIRERLGHTSDGTASNYQDYQVVDKDGKPLTRGVWVEKIKENIGKIEQKVANHRLRISDAAKAKLDDKEFLPYSDIASRMDELIRLAEIGKQFEEGKLVKEVEVVKTVTVEVPVEKEQPESEQQQQISSRRTQKDIKAMPTSELMGAKIPGSGLEKVRRAVAAIKAYNEGQAQKQFWWAINTRTLKDLTNCRTSVVEKYLKSEEGRLQVTDYNALHGLGYHHNRGRGSITEAIKLA